MAFLSSRLVSLAACGIWNWTRCRHRAPLTVWEWHPATSSPSSPGFTSPVREDIWPSVSPSIKHASQTEFRKVVYSTLGLLCLSVMLDESLVLGRDLEIQLEVRLVSDSGLLLHTGAKKTQQLSLYLNQGQVTQPCAHTDTRNNLPRTLTRLQMWAGKWFRVGGAAWRSVGWVRTPVWSVFVLCRWLCWWTAAAESSPSVSHQKSLSVMEVGTLLQVSV